jgi:hypothetical protein
MTKTTKGRPRLSTPETSSDEDRPLYWPLRAYGAVKVLPKPPAPKGRARKAEKREVNQVLE